MSNIDKSNFYAEQNFNIFDIGGIHPAFVISILFSMGKQLVTSYLEFPEIQKFMKSDEKFDVCIIEAFNADAMLVNENLKQKQICSKLRN